MIAHLSGQLAAKSAQNAVIDVAGVGYLVTASSRTLEAIGAIGSDVKLLTDMVVREDSMTLYGFASSQEKDVFSLLQTVQGVGAKAAIAILSALSPDEVEEAIMAGDKPMITRADGIGPKIATRIVNELAEKLGKIKASSMGASIGGSGGGAAASMAMAGAANTSSEMNDALSALVNLGYGRAEAFAILRQLSQEMEKPTSAQLIGRALQQLGQQG